MIEQDPDGKGAHDPGAKLDAGKNRLALVLGGFSQALWAVGEVGTYGANKYTDGGWKDVPSGVKRYSDAMLRHWIKEGMDGPEDPDTGLLHAAHLAWNALARLELMLKRESDSHHKAQPEPVVPQPRNSRPSPYDVSQRRK